MANSMLTSPTAEAMSPLPECAICLETCTKLCHPDLCMHQFCYKCLLGWWEIKEECPVCKRAFKSIILTRTVDNETATSNDDSDVIIVDDFIVVSDSNHSQEDTSSESINIVDTDSDASIPQSQMVSKVGPSCSTCSTTSKGGNRRPSKNGHAKWKPCPKSKKRQRHVTSSSSSSSSSTSSSESDSTESDSDSHGMHKKRRRFKEEFKSKKKAKRKITH